MEMNKITRKKKSYPLLPSKNSKPLFKSKILNVDLRCGTQVTVVEALRLNGPHSCQVDACFQPRLSSGSVFPAKDVRTYPPMILSAMTLEIKLSGFFRDSQLTFLLV